MRSEAEFLQSLRDGSIDGAVTVLKRIHDLKQTQARGRLQGAPSRFLAEVPAAPALGNLLFTVASVQVKALSTLLSQHEAAASSLQGAVSDALGIPRRAADAPPTHVITARISRDRPAPVRRRFVVRNAKELAGITLTLEPFGAAPAGQVAIVPEVAVTVRIDGREFEARSLAGGVQRFDSVRGGDDVAAGVEGVVPRDGTALVEVELTPTEGASLEPGRYVAALSVALSRGPSLSRASEAAQSMRLELVVT